MFSRFFAGSAALLLLLGCTPTPEPPPTGDTVTLFFYSGNDLANAEFTNPVPVLRTVDVSDPVMDVALRLLFAGPTPEEQTMGARTSDDLAFLSGHFLGARQEADAAIVNFDADALQVLNSAAARQLMVKAPIERTVQQFPNVTRVVYTIDGTPYDQWDA